jgi:hypothetical protein
MLLMEQETSPKEQEMLHKEQEMPGPRARDVTMGVAGSYGVLLINPD